MTTESRESILSKVRAKALGAVTILTALAALSLGPSAAKAETAAYAPSTPSGVIDSSSMTFGFKIVPTTTVIVTALGHYDNNNDGLLTTHRMGLWNASGTLLADATVPSGTTGTLVNGYRYINLATPLTLTGGQVYTLGIQTTKNEHYPWKMAFLFSPEIQMYGGMLQGAGTGLVYPTVNAGSNSRAPLNFLYHLPPPPAVGLTWNGSCTPSQVGANGNVTLTKTPAGDHYDVTLEGRLTINSPTYGYTRHALPLGFLPTSTDPAAYTCSIQKHVTQGDTSWIANYGGMGVHVRNDSTPGYEGRATLWFPEKFYNGEYTLRCTWQTTEPSDPNAWQGCPGLQPAPQPARTVISWNGSCTTSQVGGNGSVTITKAPSTTGPGSDVTLEGTLSILSPTYGYTRHGLPAGFLPVSIDPLAYTCAIQNNINVGDTSGIGNYGGMGVHIRNDNTSGYAGKATLWFPEKFYNGQYTLRCNWKSYEGTDPAAWASCPGIAIVP